MNISGAGAGSCVAGRRRRRPCAAVALESPLLLQKTAGRWNLLVASRFRYPLPSHLGPNGPFLFQFWTRSKIALELQLLGASMAVPTREFERFRNLELAGVEIPFLDSESLVRKSQRRQLPRELSAVCRQQATDPPPLVGKVAVGREEIC